MRVTGVAGMLWRMSTVIPARPTASSKSEPLLTSDFMARLDKFDLLSRKMLAGKMKGERRSKRRGQSVDVELQLAVHPGQRPQMRRQRHTDDHGNVCTSTDTTDGRSRTIADQVSPPSGEQ